MTGSGKDLLLFWAWRVISGPRADPPADQFPAPPPPPPGPPGSWKLLRSMLLRVLQWSLSLCQYRAAIVHTGLQSLSTSSGRVARFLLLQECLGLSGAFVLPCKSQNQLVQILEKPSWDFDWNFMKYGSIWGDLRLSIYQVFRVMK